jgi:hypothetical protein
MTAVGMDLLALSHTGLRPLHMLRPRLLTFRAHLGVLRALCTLRTIK